MYLSFTEVDQSHVPNIYLAYFSTNLLLLMSSATPLIVHLMQTWSNFEQDAIDAATDQ